MYYFLYHIFSLGLIDCFFFILLTLGEGKQECIMRNLKLGEELKTIPTVPPAFRSQQGGRTQLEKNLKKIQNEKLQIRKNRTPGSKFPRNYRNIFVNISFLNKYCDENDFPMCERRI